MKSYTVITGASSGIGKEAAILFSRQGQNLVLAARRRDRLEALKERIEAENPVQVLVCEADLSCAEECRRFYAKVRDLPLTTWINNARIGDYHIIGEGIEKMEALVRLDVEAVCLLSALFIRDFQDQAGAQLINVSSVGGYILVPQAVAYCAAKFFVSAFTEGLAYELRRQHKLLRAKVFAPAATRTEFGQRANDLDDYDYETAFARSETAQEAALHLLELASDDDAMVGRVGRDDFVFSLHTTGLFPYAENSAQNQAL